MSKYQYNIDSRLLASRLLVLGIMSALNACSTHISMTEGLNVLVGESAHKAFNDRSKVHRQYLLQSEALERPETPTLVDKEV